MNPPDQPLSLADATEDEEVTEDEDGNVIVDAETTADTTAKTKADIATMIRNTPALTANRTITPPKTVGFSNNSTAEVEMTQFATIVENPVTYGPNAVHAKTASKPETRSTNETRTQSQIRKQLYRRRLHPWRSTGSQPEIEISFDYQTTPLTPLTPLSHRQLRHLHRGWWTQEHRTICVTIGAVSCDFH
jgi:hypothetical protein